MAEQRLAGSAVTDGTRPQSVLSVLQAVNFLLSSYARNPSLAGKLSESRTDRAVDDLTGKTVRTALLEALPELPRVIANDTVVGVSAVMA
ncbi:hypothetical protein [Amycolatopsis sp. NPDC051903]|uniref:hypothetical protein n=1 Tax=Amycolatopsis sp. NPDC051903 TaxID=3363936 RepID=UPI0037B5E853